MAKNLICPHCNQEVEPGAMECPYCHQSMYLNINQVKAKEAANHVVTQEEYIAQQQQMQYQQQLNPNYNQPVQQPIGQPIGQQVQTFIDPNTGQMYQAYFDQNTNQWVPTQIFPQAQNQYVQQPQQQEESKTGLYIGLVLELIGFFIGGAIICALISLSLCKSYKGSCGLKTFVEVVAYIYIVLFLFTLVIGVLSFV
jgi:hypothetical protein